MAKRALLCSFWAFVDSLCELNIGCVTPGYNFEDTCSFLERIDDSATAEPLAMFLFLKYTKVYILNLLRSMTTIALFLRKNSSLLEDNPDH